MRRERPGWQPRGAHSSVEQLLATRFSAKHLDLTHHSRALSRLAGNRRANLRGRGIEFDEVRAYQPGDDVRAMDWRVTARVGRPHTRLFHEDRERPVLLLVDQRSSMFFGSRHCLKSVLCAELAALLAWSALDSGERVGAVILSDAGCEVFRPRRSRRQLLGLLARLAEVNRALPGEPLADRGTLGEALGRLRRVVRPGTGILLLSDFADFDEEARLMVAGLTRHCEITAFSVSDPLERELPPPGRYTVTDGMQEVMLETGADALRERYRHEARERSAALAAALRDLAVPLVALSTDEAPLSTLEALFPARAA